MGQQETVLPTCLFFFSFANYYCTTNESLSKLSLENALDALSELKRLLLPLRGGESQREFPFPL